MTNAALAAALIRLAENELTKAEITPRELLDINKALVAMNMRLSALLERGTARQNATT